MCRITDIQLVNKRQKAETVYIQDILKHVHKNISFFVQNLHFRIRSQKAYCDGHTNIMVDFCSCTFMKWTYYISQDCLYRVLYFWPCGKCQQTHLRTGRWFLEKAALIKKNRGKTFTKILRFFQPDFWIRLRRDVKAY